MPVDLAVPMSPRPRRPALTRAIRMLAIVVISMGAIALADTSNGGLADSTQEIAGP